MSTAFFLFNRAKTSGRALGLPAKIAIGAVTGMVVLGAILGPSIYFALAGKSCAYLQIEEDRVCETSLRFSTQ